MALVGAATSSVFSQGIVPFVASATSSPPRPIQFTLTGQAAGDTKAPAGSPSQISTFGSLTVAFFSTTAGTALTLDANNLPNFTTGGWVISPTEFHNIVPAAGDIPTSNVTMGAGNAGVDVQFEIVGWTGTATTFAQAEANALAGNALIGFTGSVLSGGALGWDQPTGTLSSPVNLVTGAGGYAGLVLAPVPEPSTIALGGLAAAALLAFRRRK